MNTITSHVQIWTKQFSKVSLLTIIFFASQQIHCSSQNSEDNTWPKKSTESYIYSIDTQTKSYIYSIDIKIIPISAYPDKINLEPEITISQHRYDSGETRIKITKKILDNGLLQITTETWITKNPTYFTYENGAIIVGTIILSYMGYNILTDWQNPEKLDITTNNKEREISPEIPTDQENNKFNDNGDSINGDSINGDAIVEKRSGWEFLQHFFRGVDSQHPEKEQETNHNMNFWADVKVKEIKEMPENIQQAQDHIKEDGNNIGIYVVKAENTQDDTDPKTT